MMKIIKFPPRNTWTPGVEELDRQLGNYVAKASTHPMVLWQSDFPLLCLHHFKVDTVHLLHDIVTHICLTNVVVPSEFFMRV